MTKSHSASVTLSKPFVLRQAQDERQRKISGRTARRRVTGNYATWSIARFLQELASERPTPGGGSAAALTGALGVSLGSKVCRILLARPSTPERDRKKLRRAVKSLGKLSGWLLVLVQEDAQAYRALAEAIRGGRERRERQKKIFRAKERATECPLRIGEAAVEASEEMKKISSLAGPMLRSDLKAGLEMLWACFEAARAMVEVNLKG